MTNYIVKIHKCEGADVLIYYSTGLTLTKKQLIDKAKDCVFEHYNMKYHKPNLCMWERFMSDFDKITIQEDTSVITISARAIHMELKPLDCNRPDAEYINTVTNEIEYEGGKP